MISKLIKLHLILCFFVFTTSCFYVPIALVPSNVPIKSDYSISNKRITAKACDYRIFHIPFSGSSRLEKVMEKLRAKSNNKPLVEVTVAKEINHYILFHQECTVVTGLVTNIQQMIIEKQLECSDAVLHYNKLINDYQWKCGKNSESTYYNESVLCSERKAKIEDFKNRHLQCF